MSILALVRSHRFDATAIIAVAITVLGWASAFPAIRTGLADFGPVELGALRFAIAAIPAALFLLVVRTERPTWSEWVRLGFGGVFFIGVYTTLLNLGERTVAAGAASFIINVNPILTAILATIVLGERFRPLAWAGTIVSFIGIGLIALGEGDGTSLNGGALMILGAALATAVTTIVQKPLYARHRPLTVAAWNMVLGALVLAPALPSGLQQAVSATPAGLGAVVFLGLVPGLIAYGSWSVVLSRMAAAQATNFLYCVPVISTLIGALWLGEQPTSLGLVGGALALAGVAIVNLRPASTTKKGSRLTPTPACEPAR